MAKASITFVSNKMLDNLEEKIARGRSPQAFMARVAYPMYQARQMRRWVTEGESEGQTWAPLSAKYAEWKRINFAGFPGNGEKMLIRTGLLGESVIGRKFAGQEVSEDSLREPNRAANHFVMVTDKSLTISSETKYASLVNQKRNFWYFKEDFYTDLKSRFAKWFMSGQESA